MNMKLLFIKSFVKTLVFIILVILTDLSFSPGSHRELRGVVLYFMWRESVLGSISCLFFSFSSFLRVWICDYGREREKD